MALGEVDYGLLGLVGGLTAFISFINSLMATSVGRFFAFSVGAAEGNGAEGVEECRKWFNVALLIHFVVPVVLLALGYPIGEWTIRKFLTIPIDRVEDCVWVWRFVCVSCFLSMVAVPFNAMYVAKQFIAELTIYTFVTTSLNAVFLYYMVTHPGVWLVKLSLWGCCLGIMPQIIIALRACWIFKECKIVIAYMRDWQKIKEISVYAFYRFFGALGLMARRQGIDILVNKMLGPAKNAAINVGGTVSGHSNSLSGAFLSALSPAITNAYGAGDMARVKYLAFLACKSTTIMVLLFALPLFLEADMVFRLWLRNPPDGCVPVCLGLLAVLVLDNLVCGHFISISAEGTIKGSQISYLVVTLLSIVAVWAFMRHGFGVASVAYGLVMAQMSLIAVRLYFAKRICGFSIRKWVFEIAIPIICCVVPALVVGWTLVSNFHESFFRILLTTTVVNGVFVLLVWAWVLNVQERLMLRDYFAARFLKRIVR